MPLPNPYFPNFPATLVPIPKGTTYTASAPIVITGSVISVAEATTGAFGVVKPDGATVDVSAGVISVPTATDSVLGLVKPDGSSITISAGVITAT